MGWKGLYLFVSPFPLPPPLTPYPPPPYPLSPSKHGGVDPEELLAKYGPDAVMIVVLSNIPPKQDMLWGEKVCIYLSPLAPYPLSPSPSKHSGVDCEELLAKYGPDAVMIIVLSNMPPKQDMLWGEKGQYFSVSPPSLVLLNVISLPPPSLVLLNMISAKHDFLFFTWTKFTDNFNKCLSSLFPEDYTSAMTNESNAMLNTDTLDLLHKTLVTVVSFFLCWWPQLWGFQVRQYMSLSLRNLVHLGQSLIISNDHLNSAKLKHSVLSP